MGSESKLTPTPDTKRIVVLAVGARSRGRYFMAKCIYQIIAQRTGLLLGSGMYLLSNINNERHP